MAIIPDQRDQLGEEINTDFEKRKVLRGECRENATIKVNKQDQSMAHRRRSRGG